MNRISQRMTMQAPPVSTRVKPPAAVLRPEARATASPPAPAAAAAVAVEPEQNAAEPALDPHMFELWLRQVVLCFAFSAAFIVFATTLSSGWSFLTSVWRAWLALTVVTAIGFVLARVLAGQNTDAPRGPAIGETRSST